MKWPKKILYAAGICLALLTIASWSRSLFRTYRSNHHLKKLDIEITDAEKNLEELKNQLSRQRTDQFIEEQARNKLNLIKPGEKAVILGQSDTARKPIPKQQADQLENWEKWYRLFLRL